MGFDVTHGEAPLPALLKKVRPKAANIGNEIGKICFSLFDDFLAQVIRYYRLDNFFHPILSWLRALDGDELLVNPKDNGAANFEVNIRSAAFDRRFQNPMKHFHAAETSTSNQRTKELSCLRSSRGTGCGSR